MAGESPQCEHRLARFGIDYACFILSEFGGMERFAGVGSSSEGFRETPDLGGISEVFQLNDEGIHMPAFTFEKISPPKRSPPVHLGPAAVIAKKPRGVIVQMLDRLVEARLKRTLGEDKGVIGRREQGPSD
jgi:hypothetical protein